jgi:hypothetical protein
MPKECPTLCRWTTHWPPAAHNFAQDKLQARFMPHALLRFVPPAGRRDSASLLCKGANTVDLLGAVMKPAIARRFSTDYAQASSLVGRLSIFAAISPKG